MSHMAEIGIRIFLIDQVSSGLMGVVNSFNLLAAIGFGFAASFVAFGGALLFAVIQGAALQTALTQIQIAGNQTAASMSQLQTFLLNLGGTSIFSIDQLAQGMVYVEQAGFRAVPALEAVATAGTHLSEAIGSTAVVGMTLLANTMQAFILPASQAAATADLLFYSIMHGTPNISQLQSGLAQVAGSADILHVSLADLIPAFDVLTPMMGSASIVGNSLRYALNAMISPTGVEAQAQRDLGIAFFDSTGQFVGFNAALQILHDRLSGMPPADQLQWLTKLFTQRGSQAMKDILVEFAKYEQGVKDLKAANDAAGQSANAAAKVMATLAGMWAAIKTNIQDVAALVGMAMAPALTAFGGGLLTLTQRLRDFASVNGAAIAQFLLLATAIAAIGLIIVIAMSPVGEFLGIVLLVTIAVAALALGIQALVRWIQQTINAATPMGAILRAIGAAFSALGTFIHDTLIPALQRLWTWLVVNVGAAFSAFGTWLNGTLIPALQQLWNWLSPRLGAAFSAFGTWISGTVIPAIQHLWDWIQTNLLPALQRLWQFIQTNVGPAFNNLGTAANKLWGQLQTIWNTIQTQIIPVLQNFWTNLQKVWQLIQTQILPVLQAMWTVFQTKIWPVIQAQVIPALQQLAQVLAGPVEFAFLLLLAVLLVVIAALTGLLLVISFVITFMQNLGTQIGITVANFQTFATNVGDAMNRFGTSVRQSIDTVIGFIQSIPGRVQQALASFPGQMFQTGSSSFGAPGFLGGVSSGFGGVLTFITSIPGRILGILNISGRMHTSGFDIMSAFANGMWAAAGQIVAAAQWAANQLLALLGHSAPTMGPLVGDDQWMPHMMQMFARGIESNVPLVQKAATHAAGGIAIGAQSANYVGGMPPTVIYLDGRVIYDNTMNRMRNDLQLNAMGRAFR